MMIAARLAGGNLFLPFWVGIFLWGIFLWGIFLAGDFGSSSEHSDFLRGFF